jgi:hypothetical protein
MGLCKKCKIDLERYTFGYANFMHCHHNLFWDIVTVIAIIGISIWITMRLELL